MKIAIIGCGSMGRRHIRNALALGHRVVAHDPDLNVTQHSDWPRGVSVPAHWPEDVDAYVIATPVETHAALLWQVRTAGRPMLIEKPLALGYQDLFAPLPVDHTPLDISRPGQARIEMVGYNWRFHPLVQGLWRGMAQGQGVIMPRRAELWVRCNRIAWPGSHYADTLLECSHEIDTALFLFGPAICASARCDGLAWTLVLHHTRGTETHLTLDDHAIIDSRGTQLEYADGRTMGYRVPPSTEAIEQSYRSELAHFLRCVEAGRLEPPACSLADGLAVLQICDDARRLAERAA